MSDRYRWLGGSHTRPDGSTLTNGDIVNPSEKELSAFSDLFERVDRDSESPDDADEDATTNRTNTAVATDDDGSAERVGPDNPPFTDDDLGINGVDVADAKRIVAQAYDIDPNEYSEVRQVAADDEWVSGRWSHDRMVQGLSLVAKAMNEDVGDS